MIEGSFLHIALFLTEIIVILGTRILRITIIKRTTSLQFAIQKFVLRFLRASGIVTSTSAQFRWCEGTPFSWSLLVHTFVFPTQFFLNNAILTLPSLITIKKKRCTSCVSSFSNMTTTSVTKMLHTTTLGKGFTLKVKLPITTFYTIWSTR